MTAPAPGEAGRVVEVGPPGPRRRWHRVRTCCPGASILLGGPRTRWPVGTRAGGSAGSAGTAQAVDLLDGVLGAVGDGQAGLVLQLGRDGPVPHHRWTGRSRPRRTAPGPGRSSGRGPCTCPDRPGSSREHHRQLARAPHLAAGPGDLGPLGQAELGDAAQPLLQRHPQLHAGQVGAGAAVDARTEGHVPVEGPVEDDPCRGPRRPRGRGWRPGSSSAPCRRPSSGTPRTRCPR